MISDSLTSAIINCKEDFNSQFNNPSYYINREISWLNFNKRVLAQSDRKEVPLLERLKFLGITTSNLDEFIMVRFSSVLNKVTKGKMEKEISGLNPEEEYEKVLSGVMKFRKKQDEQFENLTKKLEKKNIKICSFDDLSSKEKAYVTNLFTKNIFPLLTPINYNEGDVIIKSKQLNIFVNLEDRVNANNHVLSIIPLDMNGMKRLYQINPDDTDELRFIFLEEIIFNFLTKIFINKKILFRGCIRFLKEADIEMDTDEDYYVVDRMRQTLLKRRLANIIFMELSDDVPKNLVKLLTKLFDVDKNHVYRSQTGVIDYSFLSEKPIRIPSLEYLPFKSQYPTELIGEHDMFTAIDNNDILLHHPYETFDPVNRFLSHAAEDKNVLSIRQTLYRVSSVDSDIVESLCKAAENGKQVYVLLEIKARFDEDRNISLIDKLKNSGCKILYGLEGLKTHCKIIQIVRRHKDKLKFYSHIGTGNYNDKTAKVYTDISYFTSNAKIGEDLLMLFNLLSGFSEPERDMNKLFFSPYSIRLKLYELIDREIENTKDKKKNKIKSSIILKLNSLSDKGIIKKLYQASEAGVKIIIICRGICSIKAINKNIVIHSVVGRFLEHSRIYYFHNNGEPQIFISSADLLTRNLDRRVELMVPIDDSETMDKLLCILFSYPKDTFNTFNMIDGKFELIRSDKNFNVQDMFMQQAVENYKYRGLPKYKK